MQDDLVRGGNLRDIVRRGQGKKVGDRSEAILQDPGRRGYCKVVRIGARRDTTRCMGGEREVDLGWTVL